jgi:hypothetical protein
MLMIFCRKCFFTLSLKEHNNLVLGQKPKRPYPKGFLPFPQAYEELLDKKNN